MNIRDAFHICYLSSQDIPDDPNRVAGYDELPQDLYDAWAEEDREMEELDD